MKSEVIVFNLLEFVTCYLSLNVQHINLNGPEKLTVTFCMLKCASICVKVYCLVLFSAIFKILHVI